MVDIDGKDLQEPRLSSGGDGIGSVVRVGPCIGPVGEPTVCKVVYDAFVGVLLRAHEDQTWEALASGTKSRVPNVYSLFQGVRTTGVIEDCVLLAKAQTLERQDSRTFGSHYKITIHDRSY